MPTAPASAPPDRAASDAVGDAAAAASPRGPSPAEWRRLRWLFVGLWVAWALAWIAKARVDTQGQSWALLFDDAMISMRYASHLADGHGPVWNIGEPPIEGFTNPLWVALMTLVHLTGLPRHLTSLPVQLVSAGAVVTCALMAGRLADLWARRPTGSAAGTLAVGWVLAFGPLSTWSLLGMEVGASAALTVAVLWALAVDRRPLAYGLMAVGLLLRPDAVLVAGGALGTLALLQPERRWALTLRGGGCVALTLLAMTALRLAVFGDPLPNTYFLKLTGFPLLERLQRGGLVTGTALLRLGLLPALAPLVWAARRGDATMRAAAAVFGLHVVYSVWVGGDAWERGDSNRYLSTAMPLALGLLALAVSQGVAPWSRAGGWLQRSRAPRAAVVALVALGVLGFNAWGGASSLREAALLAPPMNQTFRRDHLEQALAIRALTRPEARVAVVAAGTIPYVTERPCVDLLGKNDRRIARMRGRSMPEWGAWKRFYPGHNKWDYGWSIGTLKPDVVTPVWAAADEAVPHLKGAYRVVRAGRYPLYLRTGSPHVRWRLLGRR